MPRCDVREHEPVFGRPKRLARHQALLKRRLVGGVEALAGVTILVALVSEIFVESVQEAAVARGTREEF
jgi:hypothetical protein